MRSALLTLAVAASLQPASLGAQASSPAPASAAQTPAPLPGQASTLTVQSQLVFVPTTVQEHHGGILYGLTARQFRLEADGVPQAVRMEESDLDHRPLSLVVAVQCSRSAFREFPKFRGLSTMVESVIGEAPAEVAVVQFGTGEDLVSTFTHDPSRRDAALNQLQPCDDGDANIYDAVEYANQILETRKASGRRAILLISETRDHGSSARVEHLIEQLNRANTVVDSISFSPLKSQTLDEITGKTGPSPGGILSLLIAAVQALRKNAPKELARQSGGEYLNFTTQKGFDRTLLTLANHVNNYYLLSFAPRFPDSPNSAADKSAGPLHSIRVTIPDYPDAVIRHRESYWADAPATTPAQ